MSSCPGLHCDGCGKGKITIGAGGITTLAGIIYYETHKQQVNQGADELLHALEIAVVVTIIAVITVVAVVAAIRIRRRINRAAGVQPAAVAARPAYVIAPPARELGQPVRSAAALPAAKAQAYPPYTPPAEPVPAVRGPRPRCTAARHPGQRI
jgi:hypothetical protein